MVACIPGGLYQKIMTIMYAMHKYYCALSPAGNQTFNSRLFILIEITCIGEILPNISRTLQIHATILKILNHLEKIVILMTQTASRLELRIAQ